MEPFIPDNHRRVLAHLGQPRTLANLKLALASDENAPEYADGDVEEILAHLTGLDMVALLGAAVDGAAVVKAIEETPGVPDLPAEKAEAIERLYANRPDRYLGGDLYILTTAGRVALGGEVYAGAEVTAAEPKPGAKAPAK